MHITDPGYAMPLELWVQAAASRLQILEIPVPLIYLDLNRSFGGVLDKRKRLNYYREVLSPLCDKFSRECRYGVPTRGEILTGTVED